MTVIAIQSPVSGIVEALAIEPRAAWKVSTPRLSCRSSGTGDLFTALFAAALVQGLTTGAALGRAVSGVLEETERRQSYELALIDSAERMLRPHPLFEPSGIPARAGGDSFAGGARRALAMPARCPFRTVCRPFSSIIIAGGFELEERAWTSKHFERLGQPVVSKRRPRKDFFRRPVEDRIGGHVV
jgi:hypothetical protein